MREIKFRAWDGKRMYYDVQKAYDMFPCNEADEERFGSDYTYHARFSFGSFAAVVDDTEEGKATLMQYTGLKDKNGKEIYEGDILVNNPTLQEPSCFKTEWWECGWYAVTPDGKRHTMLKTVPWMVVIGNIYENPDLVRQNDAA